MRFHHLALSALTFLAVNSISGNYNGIAYANEDDTTNEESIAPETTSTAYTPPETSESFTYQAEVNRMLDIVVNSLYQKKDVFLRELISNASDALDKIRFLSIEEPSLLDDKEEMEIKIQFDEAEKSITITDSGIGMTKADLISNLGTVARSGTTNFVEAIKKGSADVNMIGQFGVGFYSSFLVADRVRVASKHHDDPVQHVWESVNGQSDFHIYADPRGDSLGRGTEITLFLKEDAMEYCSGEKIKELVEFYSEFINHPIKIRTVSTMEVPVDEEEDEDEEKGGGDDEEEDDEEDEDEDDDDDDEDEKKEDEDKDDLEVGDDETPAKEKKMETVTTYSWDQVNTNRPIWNRSKDDITDDEYNQFYKVISKDNDDPAKWTHFDAEGNINFKSIMYLPGKLPYQLKYSNWNPDEKIGGLKLYVRKVLISDEFELLPPYFSKFVKGVVDSEDLPLNVNREALQESKIVKVIQKKLVRKVIEMIRKLSEEKPEDDEEEEDLKLDDDDEGEDEEKEKEDKEKEVKESPYIKWYKEFFTGLKMGVLEDDTNRMKLFKLLRFKTTKYPGDDDWVSVDDYVSRMHDWQTEIYYAAGESIDDIKDSDFMEVFKKKDVEVLYFTDPIDEYMTNSGKTSAYLLPILHTLSLDPYGIYCLILLPTRELARQVLEQIVAFGSPTNVRTALVTGGSDQTFQCNAMSRHPHFVVATPGRLAEILRLLLRNVAYLVLDEADWLLQDKGFELDVEEILNHLRQGCRKLLFSATMTGSSSDWTNGEGWTEGTGGEFGGRD